MPAPRVSYRASENSRRLLDFHVERARESLLEAGARSVDSLTLMRSAGWHLLGTARMGTDPATSVVDPWGKAHDVDNLYVVDGSVFVTAGGVNPTNTICVARPALRGPPGRAASPPAGAGMTTGVPAAHLRARLRRIADGLIPAPQEMPAPGSIDIGGRQLDLVLASRPDLADGLRRALEAASDVDDPIAWVERLATERPAGPRRSRHRRGRRLLPASGRAAAPRLSGAGRREVPRRQLPRLHRTRASSNAYSSAARSTARRRRDDVQEAALYVYTGIISQLGRNVPSGGTCSHHGGDTISRHAAPQRPRVGRPPTPRGRGSEPLRSPKSPA